LPATRGSKAARSEKAGGGAQLQLIWPWQDRKHGFSWLKASTFVLMFVPAIWLLYQLGTGEFGPVPLGGMTYWSGVLATALLLLVLAVTPALTIFRWSRLLIVRRMIGVAALVYTVAHVIIYFALRFWNFSFIANEMVTRLSLIVATVSTLGLIALGATSLDAAVRRMGAKGWNRLHSAVYVFTALALIHYLLSPGIFPEQYLMSGIFFWLMAWRALNGRGLGTDATALAILAVASCLFAALLEAGWIWAYHGFEPAGTLRNNFTLDLGVSAAWRILVPGLLIAFAAAGRRVLRGPPIAKQTTQKTPI
jgi:sulfoxide reductase heme-binding subunit YedZ